MITSTHTDALIEKVLALHESLPVSVTHEQIRTFINRRDDLEKRIMRSLYADMVDNRIRKDVKSLKRKFKK